MKVAVLGSTGFVGKVLTKKLVDVNYDVKVLVRSPEKLGDLSKRVEVVQGDYFDHVALKNALQKTEAVVSTIGASVKNPYDQDKYIKAMHSLISIMKELNIKRLILIGGAATPNNSNERFNFKRKLLKLIVNSMGKHFIQIKYAECQILMKSDLDWTVVRPPRIIAGKSKKPINVSENRLNSLEITTEDLADFIIEQINQNEWIKKTPIVSL